MAQPAPAVAGSSRNKNPPGFIFGSGGLKSPGGSSRPRTSGHGIGLRHYPTPPGARQSQGPPLVLGGEGCVNPSNPVGLGGLPASLFQNHLTKRRLSIPTPIPARSMNLTPVGPVIEPVSTFSNASSFSGTRGTMSKGTISKGAVASGRSKNRKDLSQFLPLKKFDIDEDHTRIYTVPNGITDETIVVTAGPRSIGVFRLRVTEFKDKPGKKREVELIQVHEVEFENRRFGNFAISSDCSVTLPPRKLTYAVTPFGSNLIYVFNFKEDKGPIPEKVEMDDMYLSDTWEDSMMMFDNGRPCREMALKNDQYLACILSNRVVVVWELATQSKLCSFSLKAEGIHIAWHPSESYKLFVVEASGHVKFFNVMKERCIMVEYMCKSQLYSGDWAASNSLICAVGWAGGMTQYNCSQSNTNMFKVHEQPCKVFKRVRFNPIDHRSIATLERGFTSLATIRLWRSHLPHCLWSYSGQVLDLAWMQGKSYMVALGYKKIMVFDAAAIS